MLKKYPYLKNPALKYVISKGENLTPAHRKFIEQTLHCEVYNCYDMAEFGVIGTECKYHHGFHINNESFILEIVDNSGKAVPVGTIGRVIITDLRNYAMPFIRYDTGDRGYFLNQGCRCNIQGHKLLLANNSLSS